MKKATTLAGSIAWRVCFLTDIEGNWSYVQNVVRQSSCLRFADARERQLELRDDCMLVFGGDAGDKGADTLHCYEELVRLKKKHPERVVLLAGNRDVNKMRFTSELADSEMDLRTMTREVYNGPSWVPTKWRTTISTFLAKQLASSSEDSNTDTGVDDERLASVNTKANRLRWMLEHTMGSQGDFERRRRELFYKQRQAESVDSVGDTDDVSSISDDAVLQSYVDGVAAGGAVREYLERASLAFIAHQTLFVHGGIMTRVANNAARAGATTNTQDDAAGSPPISLGHIPGFATPIQDVYEWADGLNNWYQSEVRAWIDQPTWTADHGMRGGNTLMEYVLPTHEHSVIMGRHLEPSGMPISVPAPVVEVLEASGIQRIVVGHTPHGTCPTVITQPTKAMNTCTVPVVHGGDAPTWRGFEQVVMCDTSYSDMTASDNRGVAASDVVLEPNGRVFVRGVLPDGRHVRYPTDDPFVGRRLRDGTVVKARLVRKDASESSAALIDHEGEGEGADIDDIDEDTQEYVVFKVENGFSYTYHTRTVAALREIGFVDTVLMSEDVGSQE